MPRKTKQQLEDSWNPPTKYQTKKVTFKKKSRKKRPVAENETNKSEKDDTPKTRYNFMKKKKRLNG